MYNDRGFQPPVYFAESRAEKTLDVTPFQALVRRGGARLLQLRGREKSTCPGLSNVKSEYNPRRTKESLAEASIANWPVPVSWKKHEEETKMIKRFKSALYLSPVKVAQRRNKDD